MEDLVRAHAPLVLGICLRLLGNRSDAEDVAQEVFLRVFQHLCSWDGSRPLKHWVATIALNRCRSFLGKRARQGPILLSDADQLQAPPVPAVDLELAAALEAAMAKLRPHYRLVVELFHAHELSYHEIARLVGKPVGTIKTWLHRARAELARLLADQGWTAEEVTGRSVVLQRWF
jgi:RNA polymerase sigma factor (sigma-70 family)